VTIDGFCMRYSELCPHLDVWMVVPGSSVPLREDEEFV
jgi:hypothetical protein